MKLLTFFAVSIRKWKVKYKVRTLVAVWFMTVLKQTQGIYINKIYVLAQNTSPASFNVL